MEILRFELKKFFSNNKGRIFIPIALVLILIANFCTSNISNQRMEVNKEEYFSIISEYKLGGIVTENSQKELQKLIDNCNAAEDEFNKLLYDFQIGKINRSEYEKEAEYLSSITNSKYTLNILQDQFEYAESDINNRYIMYTNSWELLFEHSSDIFFLLYSILIVTLVFAGEIDNGGMRSFNITCKNGRNRLVLSKLAVSEIVLASSYVIYIIAYFLFVHWKFGVDNSNFPIQSLQLYSEYTGSVSLINGYISVCVMRLLSLMACAAVVHFLYSLINSSIGVISFSTAFVFAPMLINNKALDYLPQNMCNYNLYDLNTKLVFILNLIIIAVFALLSVIVWKRKSDSK